jgi:hypothetical protein
MNTDVIFTKNIITGVVEPISGINNNTLITSGKFLGGLNDVDVSTAVIGNTLIYNTVSGKWEAGGFSIVNCSDVLFTNLQSSNLIKWNPANNKWINRDADYCSINIYGKLIDSVVGSNIEFNFLNPANYTEFNISRNTNNGINADTTNFDITGFTAGRILKIDCSVSYNVATLAVGGNFSILIKNQSSTIANESVTLVQPARNYVILNSTINPNSTALSFFGKFPSAIVGQSPYDINISFSAIEI